MSARILRVDMAGQPVEWLDWEQAVCLYARNIIGWTLGDVVYRIRGGHSRVTSRQSLVEVHSIIACEGRLIAPYRTIPPLTNSSLFRRDQNICLYCGKQLFDRDLTRDHIQPRSRGGRDHWLNVVTACRRCNQHKGSRTPEECGLELLALPYTPNMAEYLALVNSRRIRGDQMEFLRAQFPPQSRLRA
ncbi:MAG: HNH endonuclease [Pseudomonadota bacterium]